MLREYLQKANRSIRNLPEFLYGLKQGIPIALGYFPVAFTFGILAVKGGIPISVAILISLTNFTSAGQFAGTNLIIANASLMEIALTTFVINIRYLLMSLSLSQKIMPKMPALERYILAFGITDETFAIASLEHREITFPYMVGLIACPYAGWALGTAWGAFICSVLPPIWQNSMGIALYAMFIALLVPAAKKSLAALAVTMIAVSISSLFAWASYFEKLSGGWNIIIATIIASTAGAVLFPRKGDDLG
ncbi:MAG: AzlC family ABC transporter permease [Clostridia bacterium]|nr:AzlC family ABC transporter permease [Clostridia bacterium]